VRHVKRKDKGIYTCEGHRFRFFRLRVMVQITKLPSKVRIHSVEILSIKSKSKYYDMS
jgi:hypothetical protein